MSKTGVIVALLVAIVLAAAALLVGGRGRGQASPMGPLLAFDPARVAELRVTRSDGRFEAVRRGEPGMWDVVLGGVGEERAWPADPARMRAALRILSTIESDQDADHNAAVEPGAAQVLLTLDDGSSRSIRISSRNLAGKVLLEVSTGPSKQTRSAWVNNEVGEMLIGTGPREWRDRAALPGLGPDVVRISLKGAAGTVSLARIQGRWGLREPVQEAAEPEAVAKLLSALGNVQVMDFLDDGVASPERTGLDKPVAELTIESDQRDADGKNHTLTRSLRVGQQADIAGKAVFARLESGSSPRVVQVAADALSSLTTDPGAYVSRRAVQAPAADIGGIRIDPASGTARRFERGIEGWMEVGDAGAKTRVGNADAAGIEAFLTLVSQTPADVIGIGEAWPVAWNPAGRKLATVSLSSQGGVPITQVELLDAALSTKGGRQIVLHSGPTWRVYSAEAAGPAAAWIAGQH